MKSWEELAGEPLRFPIKGKEYVVQPLTVDEGLLVFDIIAGNKPEWTDRSLTDFYKLIMGPTWDEMRADGVPIDAASRAGFATQTDIQLGREAAEHAWETGLDPEAAAAWMAATQTTSTSSTSSESDSETPSPASTSPTTSQPATGSSPRKAKAARSPGSRSSTTGT